MTGLTAPSTSTPIPSAVKRPRAWRRLPAAAGDEAYGNCPAGILRTENRQASIVVQSQLGKQFTIDFMADYVNATVGEVRAKLDGDMWTMTRDNGEVYEVPLSAIEGG